MKPPPFQYHDPKTVAEVVGLLGRLENAKLLAGGQSLMPMLNMRFVLPDHVIDLNRVDGLSYIRESGNALEIGAMTRQRDLEFSDVIRARMPADARGDPAGRPPPDPQPRHHRRVALPSRSLGGARLRVAPPMTRPSWRRGPDGQREVRLRRVSRSPT